jgi:hypothetical protein
MIAPVPGWPHYTVSDLGEVRSLDRTIGPRTIRGKVLASFDRKDSCGEPTGYRSVTLSHEGRSRTLYVHALVMLAFVGPYPSPDHEILHGDGHRDHNVLANLRYGTTHENAADRETHGTAVRGTTHGRSKHTIRTIRAVKRRLARGEGLSTIARALNVNHGTVHHIRAGRQWAHVSI